MEGQVVEMIAALGTGTNATGELWAVGMSLQYIALNSPPTTAIHIASDSQTTVDLLNIQSGAEHNLAIVHAVRELITELRKTRMVKIFWVGGHIGLEGNDAADRLADLGTTRSQQGLGTQDIHNLISYSGLNKKISRNSHINIHNNFTSISQLSNSE